MYSKYTDIFEDIFDWSIIIGFSLINKGKINLLSIVNGDLGIFDKEDKSELYEKVKTSHSQCILNYRKIPTTWSLEHKSKEIFEFAKIFGYPVVIKPTRSKACSLAYKIKSDSDVVEKLNKYESIEFIVQEFCDDLECRVFYTRSPEERQGRVPFLLGKTTVIDENGEPLFRQINTYGSMFIDLNSQLSPELLDIFDEISKNCNLYCGRYDLKAKNLNPEIGPVEMKLLEFNDPFSMDRKMFGEASIFQIYKFRFFIWKFCFDVARKNLKRGFKCVPFLQFVRSNFNEIRLDRRAAQLDRE